MISKQNKGKFMSKKITEQDIIDSVASACQYISFYHPEDFVKALTIGRNDWVAKAGASSVLV